jgi:hypothetical protein
MRQASRMSDAIAWTASQVELVGSMTGVPKTLEPALDPTNGQALPTAANDSSACFLTAGFSSFVARRRGFVKFRSRRQPYWRSGSASNSMTVSIAAYLFPGARYRGKNFGYATGSHVGIPRPWLTKSRNYSTTFSDLPCAR